MDAAARRRRYRDDPAYRLARINDARRARGDQPVASLQEAALSLSLAAHRRQRDDQGRFA